MVTLREVEFHEPPRSASFVQQSIDMWKGFHEGLRDRVEAAVIVADTPGTVWLPDKHHGRRVAGRGRLDPAPVQKVQELAAELSELALGKALDWPRPGHGTVPRLQHKLDASVRWESAWRASQDVGVFRLQCGKGRVIGPLQLEGGVDEPDRGKMEFRAIREKLPDGCEASERGVRPTTTASPSLPAGLSGSVEAGHLRRPQRFQGSRKATMRSGIRPG